MYNIIFTFDGTRECLLSELFHCVFPSGSVFVQLSFVFSCLTWYFLGVRKGLFTSLRDPDWYNFHLDGNNTLRTCHGRILFLFLLHYLRSNFTARFFRFPLHHITRFSRLSMARSWRHIARHRLANCNWSGLAGVCFRNRLMGIELGGKRANFISEGFRDRIRRTFLTCLFFVCVRVFVRVCVCSIKFYLLSMVFKHQPSVILMGKLIFIFLSNIILVCYLTKYSRLSTDYGFQIIASR